MIIYMRRINSKCQEVFWTGETTGRGDPASTVHMAEAKMYNSYEDAYAAANKQGKMDWWSPRRVT